LTADYRHLVPLPQNRGYDFQPLADPDFERRAQSLFVETLAFLERQKHAQDADSQAAIAKLQALGNDRAAMQRWRELVHALVMPSKRAEKILKATSQAFTKPERLRQGLEMEHVTAELPWLALIDALRQEELLVYIDWRSDPDEIAAGVDQLCAECDLPALDWATVAGEDADAATVLNAAGQALAATGAVLVCLDMGSDGFPIAIVAAASCAVASAHAAAFGWRITRQFA
jgi:hypothetical protein